MGTKSAQSHEPCSPKDRVYIHYTFAIYVLYYYDRCTVITSMLRGFLVKMQMSQQLAAARNHTAAVIRYKGIVQYSTTI